MDIAALKAKLEKLYTKEEAAKLAEDVAGLINKTKAAGQATEISEHDAALITYANSIGEPKTPTLQTLNTFLLENKLESVFPIVHLLPFFPWDQDRGFSVMDYYKVEEDYGDWSDVNLLSKSVKLMFDFVANHASVDNPLIQAALIDRHIDQTHPLKKDTSAYSGFAITYSDEDKPSDEDLAALSRPRATPVLSPYVVYKKDGQLKAELGTSGCFTEGQELGHGWVWTTFSRPKAEDGTEETRQVDLNFRCPGVLLEVVKILLFYREQGASLIRLDAIGYLWKKQGSSSLHELETHLILDALYDVMQEVAPEIVTVAEVNEPQDKVFTYLGSADALEADWVYQFTHFPLAMHAVYRETSEYYRTWLATTTPAAGRQFITSLGTHDGIGMKPIRGVLPEPEIEALCSHLIDSRGGKPNYAKLPGGAQIVYEVCGTPWSLINGIDSAESFELQLRRYLTILGLSFLVRGLPAVYINGVIGAEHYLPADGLDENRTMNRQAFNLASLRQATQDSDSITSQVMRGMSELFAHRAAEPAFNPMLPPVEGFDCGNDTLLTVRVPGPKRPLIVAANLADSIQQFELELDPADTYSDLLSDYDVQNGTRVSLAPYQTCWFKTTR